MPCKTIWAYIFYLEMRGMRWQVCIVLQVCIQTKLLLFCMNMVYNSIHMTSINIRIYWYITSTTYTRGTRSRYAFKPPCNTTTKCDITSKPSQCTKQGSGCFFFTSLLFISSATKKWSNKTFVGKSFLMQTTFADWLVVVKKLVRKC